MYPRPLEMLTTPLLAWLREGPKHAEEQLRARAWAARREPSPPLPVPRRAPHLDRDARLEALASSLARRITGAELHALRSIAPRVAAVLTTLRTRSMRAAHIRELLRGASIDGAELDHAAAVLKARSNDGYLGMFLAQASL